MEVSYGIGVTNRYALFYDENEDPMDALKSTNAKEVPAVVKKVEKDSKPDKTKQAEVKAKVGPQPTVKKGPKETQPIAKPVEQIKPREGNFFLFHFICLWCVEKRKFDTTLSHDNVLTTLISFSFNDSPLALKELTVNSSV